MKIHRKEMIKKLQSLSKVCSKKVSPAILHNIKIEFAGTQVKVSGTDLDNWLEFELEGLNEQIEQQGIVNCADLLNILKSLNDDIIDVKFNVEKVDTKFIVDEKEVIKQEVKRNFVINDTFVLPTLDIENYPVCTIDKLESNASIEVNIGDLINLVEKVSYARVCEGNNYKMLQYILFKFSETKLEIACTDGHRLAIVEYPLKSKKTFNVIVHPKTINVLKSISKGNKVLKIEFKVSENQIKYMYIKDSDFVLSSRLEDYEYPNLEEILPESDTNKALGLNWDKVLKIDVATLLPVVKQLQAFYGKNSKKSTPLIKWSINENELKISAKKDDNNAEIPITKFNYSGEPVEIGINGNFLADILSTMQGTITIKMCKPDNAIMFYGEVGHIGLVMPINLEN